jgi:predicted transcriptional regulator
MTDTLGQRQKEILNLFLENPQSAYTVYRKVGLHYKNANKRVRALAKYKLIKIDKQYGKKVNTIHHPIYYQITPKGRDQAFHNIIDNMFVNEDWHFTNIVKRIMSS